MSSLQPTKVTRGGDKKLNVPDCPIVPFIEGDGVGPDVWRASRLVFDKAVEKAYGGKRRVEWLEIFAGEKSYNKNGDWLPEATIDAIRNHCVAIKGPLSTPVGGGIRSINVALRQILDLYACVRPVRYYKGVPSPARHPEKVNMIVFRENTEDVYAGIEVKALSPEAKKLTEFIEELLDTKIIEGSALGIKPMSAHCSKRLVKMALEYAYIMKCPVLTLVHKGNIMKFTEGAFCEWGYELVRSPEFSGVAITEAELTKQGLKEPPAGKVLVNDRIADNMFQQVQTRPEDYSVIATTNLNGDYLSDALAAQVGGLGLAPGANIGSGVAVFEATHGTAPKYAGQDKVNPGSLILSGKMMFDWLGWTEVGLMMDRALEQTIGEGIVTYDLKRGLEYGQEVSCSRFAEEMVARM